MAVQPGRSSAWRTLLLRGLDTASDLSELVIQKISAATDPRERQLRRRRRALRWGLIFSAGGVGLVRATAGDHRGSRCRASDDRHAAADPLPLAESRSAAGAAAH